METQILEWFKTNQKELYNFMQNCSHHHSNGNQNPFHLEGSVWTHTTMVLDKVNKENINLIFAAILHDVGKVFTRYEKETKVSFRGHENASMYKSIDILKEASKTFDIDVLKILKIVAWHGDLWTKRDNLIEENEHKKNIDLKYGNDYDLYKELLNFVKADVYGRNVLDEYEILRIEDEFKFLDNYIPYDSTKFTKEKKSKVYCLIGLSGSGKSTWLKNKKFENFNIISVDKYLEKGKLNYNSVDYEKKIKKAHDQTLVEIKDTIIKEKNCIIDMTNLTKETRRKKLSQFPSTKYEKIGIVFLNGEKEIEKNLSKRTDKKIPIEVLKKQLNSFELPGMDEFDVIEYIL